MIVEWVLVNVWGWLQGVLVGLFGGMTLPSFDFAGLVGLMKSFDRALPVHEAILFFTLTLPVFGAVLSYKVAMWVLGFVPFVGIGKKG